MLIDDLHIAITELYPDLPQTIDQALNNWNETLPVLQSAHSTFGSHKNPQQYVLKEAEIIFHPPTTDRCSFRDFYAFLQHVKSARALRNLKVVDEWFEIPVFYFSNPDVFVGHKQKVKKPKYTKELDFELEIGCIIGKKGKNIPREKASQHIAGFTILNDFSARDAQRREMKVGLGPAKGKDFATGLGPYLVTIDELESVKQNKAYNLHMLASKNNQQISSGNFADIYYGFDEMIEHASQEVTLYPGDVLGSGTVGSGCILELRPENTSGWLQNGDKIELAVERLGKLTHYISD